MLDSLIKLSVVALISNVIWRAMRPQYSIKIVIDEQGVKHHEGLPKAHQRNVVEFFEKHISVSGKVTICARRQPNGYLRLDFKGQVDPGTQQQIRNFWLTFM